MLTGSFPTTQPLAILTNIVGFSIPIPLCVSTSLQAQHIALLGYIPPILVLATVMIYAVRLESHSHLLHHLFKMFLVLDSVNF